MRKLFSISWRGRDFVHNIPLLWNQTSIVKILFVCCPIDHGVCWHNGVSITGSQCNSAVMYRGTVFPWCRETLVSQTVRSVIVVVFISLYYSFCCHIFVFCWLSCHIFCRGIFLFSITWTRRDRLLILNKQTEMRLQFSDFPNRIPFGTNSIGNW